MNKVIYWGVLITLAAVTDFFLGDPEDQTHPVVLIGKAVKFFEKRLNRGKARKLKGLLLWIIIILLTAGILIILQNIFAFDSGLLTLFNLWYLSTALSFKSLKDAGEKPVSYLDKDLKKARVYTGYIVGRDTGNLSESEILRAVVETEAENGVDGILAPLFWMILGIFIPLLNPLVLAYVYKAVNTMDSMLGYTDEPYTKFGYFPARLDDLFNCIPARIGALLYLISGFILGLDLRNGIRIFLRDRYKTPSPNAGQTESVVAGLLGIELGGSSYYFGNLHRKEPLGDALREIERRDVEQAINIVLLSEILFIMFFWALILWISVSGS